MVLLSLHVMCLAVLTQKYHEDTPQHARAVSPGLIITNIVHQVIGS